MGIIFDSISGLCVRNEEIELYSLNLGISKFISNGAYDGYKWVIEPSKFYCSFGLFNSNTDGISVFISHENYY